ncbi:hypothetical protein [Skermania piniformis]|uniref:Secreted protein n=1 Tax=Skermania pinensis TaxID=39122 RepID=A0ABX8S3P3_9ACTN|nr:hypothetical protein [Skermania piniformis]QXQ12419.1 hypothetical protein KV203_10465 [Skermania piniformis]
MPVVVDGVVEAVVVPAVVVAAVLDAPVLDDDMIDDTVLDDSAVAVCSVPDPLEHWATPKTTATTIAKMAAVAPMISAVVPCSRPLERGPIDVHPQRRDPIRGVSTIATGRQPGTAAIATDATLGCTGPLMIIDETDAQ